MKTKTKEFTLVIDNERVAVKWKTAHGGLVSAASMAVVVKAQNAIKKARGLDDILTAITPYITTETTESGFMSAAQNAAKEGRLSFAELSKLSKSDATLEAENADYFAAKLKAYCDVLSGCLDFAAMGISEGYDFAETQVWDDIKGAVEDFFGRVSKK